jgi:hypothetical protein
MQLLFVQLFIHIIEREKNAMYLLKKTSMYGYGGVVEKAIELKQKRNYQTAADFTKWFGVL